MEIDLLGQGHPTAVFQEILVDKDTRDLKKLSSLKIKSEKLFSFLENQLIDILKLSAGGDTIQIAGHIIFVVSLTQRKCGSLQFPLTKSHYFAFRQE